MVDDRAKAQQRYDEFSDVLENSLLCMLYEGLSAHELSVYPSQNPERIATWHEEYPRDWATSVDTARIRYERELREGIGMISAKRQCTTHVGESPANAIMQLPPAANDASAAPRTHAGGGVAPSTAARDTPGSDESRGLDEFDTGVLHRWETEEARGLADNGFSLVLYDDTVAGWEDLYVATEKLAARVAAAVAQWQRVPSDQHRRSLLLVGLLVGSEANWDARSDLLVGRVLGTLYHDSVRAHSNAVVHYENGAWVRAEEIPAPMLINIEALLSRAKQLFLHLAENEVHRSWDAAFTALQHFDGDAQHVPIEEHELKAYQHWAATAGKALTNLAPKFTGGTGRGKSVLDSFATWFQRPNPAKTGTLNFRDACLQIKPSAPGTSGVTRITQLRTSPANNCYAHVPMQLSFKPSDHSRKLMRLFLATTFAGNSDGLLLDMCMEALSVGSGPLPQKMIVMQGPGGDGKSLRSILRHNVFAGMHKFMTPNVFEQDDEFRKQGGQFAHSLCVTFQECNGGVCLLEEIFKKFVSGEELACRPNYGTTTQYYMWDECAKFWEMNLITPAIKGSPDDLKKLRSWLRRIIVVVYKSTYSGAASELDVDGRIFREDSSLKMFLASPEARCVYFKYHLLPFIEQHSQADCVNALSVPPAGVKADTDRFVQQMANGGLRPYEHPDVTSPNAGSSSDAVNLVLQVHAELTDKRIVKKYLIDNMRCVPGTIRDSARTVSRYTNFNRAVAAYPYLFRWVGTKAAYERLNIDFAKYNGCVRAVGLDAFGNDEDFNTVFAIKDIIGDVGDDALNEDVDAEPRPGDVNVETLDERANLDALLTYQAKGTDRHPVTLQNYINRLRNGGVHHGDGTVTIRVMYYRKHGWPGRCYARGVAGQSLTREARSVAFGGHSLYVDMANSHAVLLYSKLQSLGVSQEYPALGLYVRHYKRWRAIVGQFYGIDEEAAKMALIRILYGGRPRDDSPILWRLAYDVSRAMSLVVTLPEFDYLAREFTERRSPDASRLSYALYVYEDRLMRQALAHVQSKFQGAQPIVYLYDGFVIDLLPENKEALQGTLEDLDASVQEEFVMFLVADPPPAV
jgi:hypothetical protein